MTFPKLKNEKKLRESEERFKKLSKLTFEGILIHDNGIAIDLNDSLLKMIGNKRKEVIGNNVIELCVPKEFHKIIVENTGKKFTEPYEAILKRKNGKLVPIEIESRNVAEEGKQYRVTAIRDITERKNAEAENEK